MNLPDLYPFKPGDLVTSQIARNLFSVEHFEIIAQLEPNTVCLVVTDREEYSGTYTVLTKSQVGRMFLNNTFVRVLQHK